MRMNIKTPYLLLALATLALGGCSAGAGLLDGKSGVPQASNVPVGNNLALPPDLQLAAPTATSDAYQPNGPVASATAPVSAKPLKQVASTAASSSGGLYGTAAASPSVAPGDIFAQYGISRYNPDGTQKTQSQLASELNAAILKRKQQQTPGYGTIANIGSIFQ